MENLSRIPRTLGRTTSLTMVAALGAAAPSFVANWLGADHLVVFVASAAALAALATLIGQDGQDAIGAAAVAAAAGTISWDVLASLQPRLPRFYHREGAVEAIAPPMW